MRVIRGVNAPASLLVAFALSGAAVVAPAVSNAAECGPGTMYDAATDLCVVAPSGPPPAEPAQWQGPPPPPPLPPISICPPIPFVAVCFPVN